MSSWMGFGGNAYGAILTVAKTTMLCPFSNRLCKECAVYRGRHYYLCFCRQYRGSLRRPDESAPGKPASIPRADEGFSLPSQIPPGAIDPFVTERENP